MAGCGPAPKPTSRTRHKPQRGSWQASPGVGWQHGPIPEPPDGIGVAARRTWDIWFKSWFASNWTPDYLPQIETAIKLFHQCAVAFDDPYVENDNGRGGVVYVTRTNPTTELRQWLDGCGISFKGQQDRRWTKAPDEANTITVQETSGKYRHLRAVASE